MYVFILITYVYKLYIYLTFILTVNKSYKFKGKQISVHLYMISCCI